MSGFSPARRIRSKTSDITEFFRSNHNSSQSRLAQNDLSTQSQATINTLDVPSTTSQDGLTKKKSTRIPFLGRSRKKSNPPSPPSPFATSSARESSDVGEQSSRAASTDRNLTVEFPDPQPSSRLSMLLAPSPVKPPSTSLGSKLAAHFHPSRTRKLSTLNSQSPVESISQAAASSSTNNNLAPPSSTARGASFDSTSSGASQARSPTPRATKPTITVSMTPDDLAEYKDLFTMPKQKTAKTRSSSSSGSTPRQNGTPDSDVTPNSSPPASPRVNDQDLPRRGSAPTVIDVTRQKIPRSHREDQATSRSTKPARRPSIDKNYERQSGASTPRSSDGRDSVRTTLSDKGPTSSLQRRTSSATPPPPPESTTQHRSRMKQPSSSSEKRNRPPSMPLPLPPVTPPPPTIPPPLPPGMPSRTSSSASVVNTGQSTSRPRANTVGSVSSLSSSPLSQSTLPESSKQKEKPLPVPKAAAASFDINVATHEQLKDALKNRNLQYDELATYLLRITDQHVSEVTSLEKKISHLDRELSKKDNQIKGLMWLVANNKGPPATDFPAGLALPPIPTTRVDSDQETQKLVSRMPVRRMQFSDDSGAESHPTSGAESIRTSETSGNESSSFRSKKLRRPFTLGETSYNLYRAATGSKRLPIRTLAPDSALPDVPYLSAPASKRSSVSSISASPSSSTSSLLPPSPSVTVSSLSAIPETPSSSLRLSSKPETAEQQEERRAARASHRISTSSMASSSTAASSYAGNLKRSRPPSIAQVLEKSPNMEEMLEKLRPFGP